MHDPLRYSDTLGRVIRCDDIDTLGISSLTLAERAAASGDGRLAGRLVEYFWDEALRIGTVLFVWIESITTFRMARAGMEPGSVPGRFLAGIRTFDPSTAERDLAISHLVNGDSGEAFRVADLGRIRYAALHDAYVVWIQELLAGIATDFGEEAVRESIDVARREIWEPRYVLWESMTPIERLQLSVEGMRGHLSGARRRGDVGIIEERDRFVMVLDPCGSCGVLRRGDPESGRAPYRPAGNKEPHDWTWGRTGVSWYAVHSPIAMEYAQMTRGRPPRRPHEDCDTAGACRWFVYKDANLVRPEHYGRMGFVAPVAAPTDTV